MLTAKLSAIVALCFSTLIATSPLAEEPWNPEELERRHDKCHAIRNYYKTQEHEHELFEVGHIAYEQMSPRAETNEAGMQLLERSRDSDPKEQHCCLRGHIVDPPKTSHIIHQVTLQQCANWCLCTLGRKHCESFGFVKHEGHGHRGVCSAYTIEARYLHIKPGGDGVFYAHHCFHKSGHHKPPPPMTTPSKSHKHTPPTYETTTEKHKPTHHPKPPHYSPPPEYSQSTNHHKPLPKPSHYEAKQEKREDIGNIILNALIGF